MKLFVLSVLALTMNLNAIGKRKPPAPVDSKPVGSPVLNLKDSWHLSMQADYLYWNSNEIALPYAMKVKTVLQIPSEPTGPFSLEPVRESYISTTNWNSGFRVGLGIDFPYDGWTLLAQYTYYRSQTRDSKNVPFFEQTDIGLGTELLIDPWSNPADTIITSTRAAYYQSIHAQWKLSLQLIDLTLSRPFWISRSFAITPFAGLRAAWNNTRFQTTAEFTAGGSTNLSNSKKFKNNYFGAGIVAGVKPTFYFNKNFFLFNTLDFSLLYGYLKSTRKSSVTSTPALYNLPSHLNSSFNNLQPIFDLNLGLGWGSNTKNDRVYYEFKIGYEAHAWLNSSNRTKLLSRSFDGSFEPFLHPFDDFINTSNNLFFQGVFGSFDIHY